MAQSENWSWGKFFLGFVDGRNYAKSLVYLFCMVIIITVGLCVYSVVKSKFIKKPTFAQSTSVGTNAGTMINTDTHDSTEKKGWQLFGGLIQINN